MFTWHCQNNVFSQKVNCFHSLYRPEGVLHICLLEVHVLITPQYLYVYENYFMFPFTLMYLYNNEYTECTYYMCS